MILRRYEWTGAFSNFYNLCANQLASDPFWKVRSGTSGSWDNWGSIEFENIKKPEMTFTLSAYSGNGFAGWRTGMGTDQSSGRNNFKPNVFTNYGGASQEIAVTSGASTTNGNFDWYVFTSTDYIFIFANTTNGASAVVPIRLFMGLMKPYEEEDPAIAENFWGIMPMAPMSVNSSIWGNNSGHNVGRGMVYRSRNNALFPNYYFETSSVIPSPGTNGKYYISPFYVFEPNEGVRGEFGRVFTAVLSKASSYTDGSILKVEGRTYYVFHVTNQTIPTATYYRHSDGVNYYNNPYFFGSNLIPTGQRVLLFDITEKEPVKTLTIDKASISVEKGKSTNIKVTETVVGESGTIIKDVTLKVKYTVGNISIASINTGTITGLNVGSTTLKIEVGTHDPVIIPITVTPPPPTISLTTDKSSLSILKYKTDTFKVIENSTTYDGIVTPTDVTAAATYEVDNSSIVSVSGGTVTALSVGTAKITAKYSGRSSVVNVEVLPPLPVHSLVTDKNEVTMKENETSSFVVTKHTDNDGVVTNTDVTNLATYTIADPLTASVDKGTVTGIEDGATTIEVEFEGMKKTVNVVVLPADAVVTMSVDKTDVSIKEGLTDTITVTKHTDYDDAITDEDITTVAAYSSADETIATVANGVITAVTEGSTTITVGYGGLTETVNVTVIPVISIVTMSVDKSTVTLEPGQSDNIVVTKHTDIEGTVTDTDITAIAEYLTSDDLVATIIEGTIFAQGEGATTITITHDGMTETVEVIVTAPVVEEPPVEEEPPTEEPPVEEEPPTEEPPVEETPAEEEPPAAPVVTLSADKTEVSIENGSTDSVIVTKTTDDNGVITNEDVTALAIYSSDDEPVAIAANGIITAVGAGTAIITITHEEMTVTINVTVTEPEEVTP